MDRRTFVLAGPAAFGALKLSSASAQENRRIVVANWGGDWNDRTVRFVEQPLLEQKGWTIVRDLNDAPQRTAKLIAEKRLPRNTTDVNHYSDSEIDTLSRMAVLSDIDYSRITLQSRLLPALRQKKFVPWIFSDFESLYNPKRVKGPITGFKDLWDPQYKDKVGIIDGLWLFYMQAASLAISGKPDDFAAAKKGLLQIKQAVTPKFYAGHQQLASALKSEDVWVSMNFRSRVLQWQNDGLDIAAVFPQEGAMPIVFGATIPEKASNKDGAYAYINALLDPGALAGLCAANFYAPAITGVSLPAVVQKKLSYSPEEQKKIHGWDYPLWTKTGPEWQKWWQTSFVTN